MGVFWDVFWAVACICGLAFVGWWLFGLLLRPLPGRTVRVVLTGRDGGEELEQQVKSFIWLRGLGLLRCPIVIADVAGGGLGGTDSEGLKGPLLNGEGGGESR